jgi:hypothetical protein
MDKLSGISDIFEPDKRLRVSVGDSDRTILRSKTGKLVGLDISGNGNTLGDAVVLAKSALEIATVNPSRKNRFRWMEMVERLFLYGIDGKGNDTSVSIGIERPTLVDPDPADSCFPIGYGAEVRAQSTADFVVFELFVV